MHGLGEDGDGTQPPKCGASGSHTPTLMCRLPLHTLFFMICTLLLKPSGLKSEFYNGFKVHEMLLLCQPQYSTTQFSLPAVWRERFLFGVCTKFPKFLHTLDNNLKVMKSLSLNFTRVWGPSVSR